MPRRKYLTEASFNEWKDNHFQGLVKEVCKLKGKISVIVGLSVGAFLGIVFLVLRSALGW